MPFGDMTGPEGNGPGTGRRMGKMAGNKMGAGIGTRRKLRNAAAKATATKKLGSGARFKATKKSIASGLKSSSLKSGQTREDAAGAIAASIGRRKYGDTKMANMSSSGRKRRSK